MKRPKPRRRLKAKRTAGDDFRKAMRQETDRERIAAVAELRLIVSRTLMAIYGEDCEAAVFLLHELVANPNGARCIECGVVAGHVMSFVPNRQCRRDDLKLPEDQKALILYPMCVQCKNRCAASIDVASTVENRIIADLIKHGMIDGN